jgi:hypothetical protein
MTSGCSLLNHQATKPGSIESDLDRPNGNIIKPLLKLSWEIWGVKNKSAAWRGFPEMADKIVPTITC